MECNWNEVESGYGALKAKRCFTCNSSIMYKTKGDTMVVVNFVPGEFGKACKQNEYDARPGSIQMPLYGHRPKPEALEHVVIGTRYKGEAYATLKFGDNEVEIGYTAMTGIRIDVDGGSPFFKEQADLSRAMDFITQKMAEAS